MRNIESLRLEQIRGVRQRQTFDWLLSEQYRRLSKGQKGIVRRFLVKVAGLSRAQVTRFIAGWVRFRRVQRKPDERLCFPRRCRDANIMLLLQ